MKKKVFIGIFGSFGALILIFLIILASFFIAEAGYKNKDEFNTSQLIENGNRIHFLNTGGSDAILLESDGHFALIDCAEDSDNPRGFEDLIFDGYEDFVVDYVLENASGENGIAHLHFVLGTHAHSDHIGGFDTLISNDKITVDKAYLKEYDESRINSQEIEEWDNKEVYQQMVDACNEKGVPIISDIPKESFNLGNMKITLYNTEYKDMKDLGENENSLGVLVEVDGKRIFLAGDINNIEGDEDRIADELGKIDVLKLGHHGYAKSSSIGFLQKLDPEIAIVTNKTVYVNLGARMTLTANQCPFYGTVNQNGIILQFSEGQIQLFDDIHK